MHSLEQYTSIIYCGGEVLKYKKTLHNINIKWIKLAKQNCMKKLHIQGRKNEAYKLI